MKKAACISGQYGS